MSVVEGFERVRESDLGILSIEVDRICRDLTYGANVDDALRRFGLRVRTTAPTRVVTLLTNPLRASGNLAPVLRIAGEQAASELKLRRKRRQQMFTYLVVIYISFLVFLVIIVAVQEVLVPSLPNNVPTPESTNRLAVNVDAFARFGQVNKAAYTLVFFHTAIIQAVLSGFIGGQLGEGSLKDGAKHATVMLAVAYVAFLLLSSPVAQVTFTDQTVRNDRVVVDSVSMSHGGFVVVRARTPDGEIVGHSRYLEPGEHRGVRVPLERTYGSEMQLYAVPHLYTDEDERFRYAGRGTVDGPYTTDGNPVFDQATVSRGAATTAERQAVVGVDRGRPSLAARGLSSVARGPGGATAPDATASPRTFAGR
jgi:flagellar protein FlaJ